MTDDPRPPHHHGNLRQALVMAGLDLLREGGPGGLTLRRAAARAGVSHAAPAHHFDGLAGLMTAMAAKAFGQFTASMASARQSAPPGPRPRLEAICQGYLDFAATNRGLFHLLFVAPEVDRSDPALSAASAAAYGELRAACLPFSATGTPDPVIEIGVWSMVHGYALLGLTDPASPRHRLVAVPGFSALLARLVPESP